MENWLQREISLIGEDAVDMLSKKKVAVVGLGGVGGAAFEAVVRCGVGQILAVDADVFEVTNLNRQILATTGNLGKQKAAEAKKRAESINPGCRVESLPERITPENVRLITGWRPDFVIDAIDTVSAKLALIERCRDEGINIISSMGTGNRLDARGFKVGFAEDTAGFGCGLARVMRRELRRRGLNDVPVLYCETPPIDNGNRTPASISFVPPVAGYLVAGYVVNKLLEAERLI